MSEQSADVGNESNESAQPKRGILTQAGINAGIGCGSSFVLALIVTLLVPWISARKAGELTASFATDVTIVVFIFSLLWLKRLRVLAIGLVSALLIVGVFAINAVRSATSRGHRTFVAAADVGPELTETDTGVLIVHRGLGIEMSVPLSHLEPVPIQSAPEGGSIWGFVDPDSGSSFVIGADYQKLNSREDVERYLSGVVVGASEVATERGFELNVVSTDSSEETMSALTECAMGDLSVVFRVISVGKGYPGHYAAVTAQVFSLDREMARAAAQSLVAAPPSYWYTTQ